MKKFSLTVSMVAITVVASVSFLLSAEPAFAAVCGEACTAQSQCVQATGAAFQPICFKGKCANPLCPTYPTPGTICSCGAAPTGPACGDLCGSNGNALYPVNCQGGVCGNSQNPGATGNRCLPPPAPSGYVTGRGVC